MHEPMENLVPSCVPHVHDTYPQFPLNCHFQLKLSSSTLSIPPTPLTFQEGIFHLYKKPNAHFELQLPK